MYTNDHKRKTITLQLSAKVNTFARYPKRISLQGKASEKISATHTIIPEPQFQFDIVRTYAENGDFIKFSLDKQKSQFTLVVENTKKTAGRYWDRIHLVTNSKIQKEISIPIYGSIIDESEKKSQP